jgi:FKBP12-rapamycin complex-associated protein
MSITTYPVVHFTSFGLIGWVEDCDTVSNIVVKYRKQITGESPLLEQDAYRLQVTERMRPLPEMRRILDDCLRMSTSGGDEIGRILVMSSADSKDWIGRRLTYTSSLASTSLAAYVLGLGDRHLGNIMMNMRTSKLIHIDYGDCFEVLAKRAAWPEVVPFRLTRMLTRALEVVGVDGTFLKCATIYMKVMRAQKEELLGLLETFHNDPFVYPHPETRPSIEELTDRIRSKLNGTDGKAAAAGRKPPATPKMQVKRLIHEAIDPDRLCQMFCGWTPYW